jgi:hypothetical protein
MQPRCTVLDRCSKNVCRVRGSPEGSEKVQSCGPAGPGSRRDNPCRMSFPHGWIGPAIGALGAQIGSSDLRSLMRWRIRPVVHYHARAHFSEDLGPNASRRGSRRVGGKLGRLATGSESSSGGRVPVAFTEKEERANVQDGERKAGQVRYRRARISSRPGTLMIRFVTPKRPLLNQATEFNSCRTLQARSRPHEAAPSGTIGR